MPKRELPTLKPAEAVLRLVTRSGWWSFKDVINDQLRAGNGMMPRAIHEPFQVEPHASSYRCGVNAGKLNQLLDDLDAEAGLD